MPDAADRIRRMWALFNGLKRAYGINTNEKPNPKGKLKGRARTIMDELTTELWEKHLLGEIRLGVVPIRDDNTVRFGAIDIDDYSIGADAMEKRAQELNLPVIISKTRSGGAHLWVFLSEDVDAGHVRETLMSWATALGYPSAEVFPKQETLASREDVGNWIHMPYCGVFGSECVTYGIRRGEKLDIDDWLDFAESSRVPGIVLSKVQIPDLEGFEGAPPCLQALARYGVPEGQRNNALFGFAVFCKKRSGDDWENDVDKINYAYMKPPLSRGEVSTIIDSLKKKEYFYPCKQQPFASVCNKERCRKCEFGIGGQKDDLGIQIVGITKVNTDPPYYFVQVNGQRIELPSSDILLSQQRFQKAVFEGVNIVPQQIKQSSWTEMINRLMQEATYIDAPEDAGVFGQFQFHLRQFCTVRAQARSRAEILQGKAWHDENDTTWFRAADLSAYLERQKFRHYPPSRIWALLKEKYNAKHAFFNEKGQGANIWGIPSFTDTQNEEFDVPKGDETNPF